MHLKKTRLSLNENQETQIQKLKKNEKLQSFSPARIAL